MAGRKRFKKFFNAVVGTVVVVGLAGYGYVLTLTRSTEKSLAALRESGIPTSIDEYRESLPHEGLDAMSYYNALLDNTKVRQFSAFGSEEFRAQLAKRATLARRAGANGWCDFFAVEGRIPTSGENASLASGLQQGAEALVQNVSNNRKDVDPEVRFNDIVYADRIAANRARSAVGHLEIRQALLLEDVAMEGWYRMLAADSLDPDTVKAASRALDQMPPLPSLKHLFTSQFVAGRWINKNLSKYLAEWTPPGETPTRDEMHQKLLVSQAGELMRETEYVGVWKDLFSKLPSDPEDWRSHLEAVREIEDTRPNLDDVCPWSGIHQMPKVIGPWAERLATRRMSATAVSVLKQRIHEGEFPESLPSLGLQSTDPFTGKPFGYKKLSDGFLIYSQGAKPEEGGGLFARHYIPGNPMSQLYSAVPPREVPEYLAKRRP